MTKDGTNEFGYNPSEEGKKNRSYHLTPNQWFDLFVFMWACVQNGACPSVYTSGDGNALCLSVKHGKTEVKYWIGPDDDSGTKIEKAFRDWNVSLNIENPLDQTMQQNIALELAAHGAKNKST